MPSRAPTPLSYRELPASRGLEHLVWSYWEITLVHTAAASITQHVFPDGCVGLCHGKNANMGTSWFSVVGPRLEAFSVEQHGGDRRWGIRLSPAASRLILGCDPATLQNRVIPAAQILSASTDELQRKLDTAQSFALAIAAYDAYLLARGIRPAQIDRKVAEAVRLIDASQGQARMSSVAAAVQLGARNLQRRFRAAAGLTPKQFARTRRLRAVATLLVQQERAPLSETSWVARANETGFADQAHLTRELVAMTGKVPGSFAEEIAAIEHGKLVK